MIAEEIPDKSKGPGDQLLLTWIRQELYKAFQIHGGKVEDRKNPVWKKEKEGENVKCLLYKAPLVKLTNIKEKSKSHTNE